MTSDPKDDLHRYLRMNVDALRWKLDGLSEHDMRRPLTTTGTNLLGLVKHVASVGIGYFGPTFGRDLGEELPWFEDGAEPNADLWCPADEPTAVVLGLHDRAWEKIDAVIAELEIDAIGTVPWWPEERAQVTLHRVLVHMATEVARHAGQADIVRELIDGQVGLRLDNDNLWAGEDGWAAHRARVQAAADRFPTG